MRASNLKKSLVLVVLITAGSVVPTLTGKLHENQAVAFKSLSVSPVQVTLLGARG